MAAKRPQPGKLPAYEGQEVVAAGVSFTNVGGGFDRPLTVHPQAFSVGDSGIYAIVRLDCVGVSHKSLKDAEDKLKRGHNMRVTGGFVYRDGEGWKTLHELFEDTTDMIDVLAAGSPRLANEPMPEDEG
jgi:hypothetical protein